MQFHNKKKTYFGVYAIDEIFYYQWSPLESPFEASRIWSDPGWTLKKVVTLTGDITEILPIVLCELKKLAAAPAVIFYMDKVEAPALRC